jgi:sterol desaturase/sphingolipid hydroxylase (fatty acid hydroxylase superfamily)
MFEIVFDSIFSIFGSIFDTVTAVFYSVQAALFETLVLPVVRALHLTAFTSAAFDGTELFLLGALQIALLYAIVRPLELWRPAEMVEIKQDRSTDVSYTLLHRLGGFALLSFFMLTPLLDGAEAELRLLGISRFQLDALPLLAGSPLLLFLAYVIVLDLVGYWIHRGQHRIHLWWQLHALHHANRSMSLWSDNRNHLLDDCVLDIIMAIVAWFIGVEPAQFVLLTVVSRGLQSLQHANVRLPFGWLGERLIVSPSFHRVHHSVHSGYEGKAMGCNFGVLLPWWDSLFGTAKWHNPALPFEATGVRDQATEAQTGRNYGVGFWAQQQLGVLRLLGKA